VETFAVAATHAVATSSPVDLAALPAPPDEPQIGRWPGWARLAIIVGGSAVLWGGIAWAAARVLHLG
jgi:hypothetical protein